MPQLNYTKNLQKFYPGTIADDSARDIDSYAAEVNIPFGVAVSRGADPQRQCTLGGAVNYLGVAIRSLEREGAINSGDIQYTATETVGVMSKGAIAAVCPSGCTAGASVNYDDTTGVLDSGSAGVGETNIVGAYWDTTTGAGSIGVIKLKGNQTTAGS